jgi:hypothetical protein
VDDLVDLNVFPDPKWQSIINIRESTFGFISTKDAAYIAEHSLLGFVECLAMRSADSVIDDIELLDTGFFPEFALTDTVITTSVSIFFGKLFLDAVTSYFAEKNDAITTFIVRETVEDNSRAFLHAARNVSVAGNGLVSFNPGESFMSANAAAGGRPLNLPLVSAVSIAGSTIGNPTLLGQQRIVTSDPASLGTLTVGAIGADTIRGGPVALGPGESAVFVPIDSSTWVVVATNP